MARPKKYGPKPITKPEDPEHLSALQVSVNHGIEEDEALELLEGYVAPNADGKYRREEVLEFFRRPETYAKYLDIRKRAQGSDVERLKREATKARKIAKTLRQREPRENKLFLRNATIREPRIYSIEVTNDNYS